MLSAPEKINVGCKGVISGNQYVGGLDNFSVGEKQTRLKKGQRLPCPEKGLDEDLEDPESVPSIPE